MQTGNERSRSPSPSRDASLGYQVGHLPKGSQVLFYHAADPAASGAAFVRTWAESSPWLLQSHGWLQGVLQQPFDPSSLSSSDKNTWPLVLPRKDIVFVDKTGKKIDKSASAARRCLLIRELASLQPPVISLVFVRWGGKYSAWMDEEEENDGDWGKYGSPPSDSYMTALVDQGVAVHPKLTSKGIAGPLPEYEIFQFFVGHSKHVALIAKKAEWLASSVLKGRRKTCFWMLWPAEWQDTGDPDFACYVERQSLFNAMRACEAAGIRSGFPHPSDLLETITSKTWMATLCLNPQSHLPAAAMVSRELIASDPQAAARHALATLEHIRSMRPFKTAPDEAPAPSAINKDGIKKGMVKCGWSWENRFVLSFNSAKQLETRMSELMGLPGCLASCCIVQEWVDFDFEMRLYFLLAEEWLPGARLDPRRIECNIWGQRNENAQAGSPAGSFSKLSHEQAIAFWEQDVAAWEDAKAKAIDISQFLVSWLRVVNAQPVPMIRLDFMLKRVGPGKARVFFGEYCEVGACCLGWKEGPPAIWRVVLDSVLR